MPAPKAMGTQGSKRPAPASAATHSRSFAASDGQVLKPDGAMRPAASRGGHVPAIPCVRALLPSSIPVHPTIRSGPQCYRKLQWRA